MLGGRRVPVDPQSVPGKGLVRFCQVSIYINTGCLRDKHLKLLGAGVPNVRRNTMSVDRRQLNALEVFHKNFHAPSK